MQRNITKDGEKKISGLKANKKSKSLPYETLLAKYSRR